MGMRRVRVFLRCAAVIALLALAAQPALAHETDTAHIEPEVIVLAAGIPIAVIVVGAIAAYLALRADRNKAESRQPPGEPDGSGEVEH